MARYHVEVVGVVGLVVWFPRTYGCCFGTAQSCGSNAVVSAGMWLVDLCATGDEVPPEYPIVDVDVPEGM